MTDIIKKETMTSREISELTGKRHDHVLRDVRRLESHYDKTNRPKLGLAEYKDKKGEARPEYLLNKSQCMDLAMGYDMELRIKVRERWENLELNGKPQSKIEWIQLALDQEKKVLQLEETNETLQIELDEHKSYFSVKRVILLGHFKHKEASRLWRPLRKWCLENGYNIMGIFDANYGEVKTYHKDAWKAVHNVEL